MSSDAQIQANRANAQKSTGPRTPNGKARAAQNARCHGFTASSFTYKGRRDSTVISLEHLYPADPGHDITLHFESADTATERQVGIDPCKQRL